MKAVKLFSVVSVFVLTVMVAKPVQAIPAIDFLDVTQNFTNGSWSLGFEFTTTQDITVTHLGFYDDLVNGLTQSHDVGIYDISSENLLASTTVNNGDPLDGFFRYNPLAAPLNLSANNTYRIAAVTGSENYTWAPVGFTADPALVFNGSVYTSSASLVYPSTSQIDTDGYFGPNFQFELASNQGGQGGEGGVVPEPMTLSLFGAGLAGLLGSRSRKIRS